LGFDLGEEWVDAVLGGVEVASLGAGRGDNVTDTAASVGLVVAFFFDLTIGV